MAHVLIMPRQGNTVESCVIGEWKVKEGDEVAAGTTVCVVETDKATIEVSAGAAGTVLKILHGAGDDVPVLQPIMVIGKAGEDWQAAVGGSAGADPRNESEGDRIQSEAASAAPTPAAATEAGPAAAPAVAGGAVTLAGDLIAASPRARKLAEREAVDLAAVAGSGPGGRIVSADVDAARQHMTAAGRAQARDMLKAGGLALAGSGTGIGGRHTLDDIARAAAGGAGTAQALAGGMMAGAAGAADEYVDTPIKGIRAAIAKQMMNSHTMTAAFTLNASAQATNLQKLRARFKASPAEMGFNKITVNDLVLFAASRLLPLYPYMNAHKLDNTVRQFRNVHLGVAVSTPRGLMVPVLRNANLLSLAEISSRARALAEACRGGTIAPDDLKGSTLTVTNLGNTGIESFTPVINIPEVAILGVCSILPKAAETSPGQFEIVPQLGFSLTIDHAVVDGAPAAEFLKALCAAIRDIDLWLAK